MASMLSSSRSAGASGKGSPAAVAARPRTISSRPAPPASTTPASRSTSSCSGVRATASSPRRTSLVKSSGLVRPSFSALSPSSAISRMTESIVPSTGWRTARYAASLADRKAAASVCVSTSPFVRSVSAAPRMICERMTPELPRAPISAARVTSLTRPARSSVVVLSSSSTTARAVIVRFVPVSPSGTG